MGLFGKHKGKAKAPFTFGVLVHTLAPFPAGRGPLCITYGRGSHSGATQPANPSRGSSAYVFEQQLVVPATLYQQQDARRGGARGAGAFERKELTLAVVAADARGRPAGSPLGTVVLNLADYAAAEGRSLQQAFTVAPAGGRSLGGAKLLLTIRCQEGRASGGGGPAVDRSISSMESAAAAEALAAADEGELPTTLSSDDEGSRPSSRANSSRPGSRAADAGLGPRAGGALAAVPEDAAAAAGKPALGGWQQAGAGAAAAASTEPEQSRGVSAQASGLHDDDGFLIDSSVDASVEQEAEASASVRRNLGSALERAEASEASRQAAEAGVEAASRPRAAPEVQSQLSSSSSLPRQGSANGAARLASSSSFPSAAATRPGAAPIGPSPFLPAALAAAAAESGASLERAGSGARLQAPRPVAVPAPASETESGELQSPDAYSAGQLSSLSAAGDPAIPFSVPPSTQRRFARHGEEGAAGGRRWAWRREGGRPGSGGAGGSMFQRARIASVTRQESSDGAPGGAAVEASARSAASSSAPSVELSSRRTTSEDPAGPAALPAASAARQGASPVAAPLEQQVSEGPSTAGASAAAAAAAASAFAAGASHPAFTERGAPTLQRPSADAAAAALAAAQRQRSLLANSALLRPAISLVDSLALPSPVDQLSPSPYGNNPLADALVRELRTLAALESAVYLAGGRRAFAGAGGGAAGSSRQLHAPARRLARTILSLGPQEGLAFGLQAIRAIEATAGAASGDMHRLTFWWSNILQLRWMFWALGQGPDAAVAAAAGEEAGSGVWTPAAAAAGGSAGRLDELDQQGSAAHWSPRAAAAAAAGSKHGMDWMQLLLAPLRELEGWLFSEMLKHLWWRVLLQEIAALQPNSSSSLAGTSPLASSTAGLRGSASNSAIARSAQSAPHLAAGVARGSSEGQGAASLQGTPRSFETPEEEAVQRWVVALGGVERALRARHRPPPAPRPHLALLHRQLIVALLHRLDTLLFRKLLLDEGEVPVLRLPSMSGRDTFSRSAEADEVLGSGGAEAAAVGLLEPSVLPFQRGPVTFGTGVNLKMAVSRLTGWAADCGVKEDRLPQAARSTEMSDYRLFPCLRATADLLMMPKEVLTDASIRREVVPGLPLHRVCQLLERFQPDDCAPDPLPPGLLEALQSESPRSDGSTPSPTSKAEDEYAPPPEASLLADGVIEPLSLELDEESEDELESLAGMPLHSRAFGGGGPSAGAAGLGSGQLDDLRAQRFVLLRELWAAAPAH